MTLAATLRAQAAVLVALADELERGAAAPSDDTWIPVGRPPADLGARAGELRAAIRRGEIPATTSGRRVLVRRADVRAWLEARAACRVAVAPAVAVDPVAATAARMGLRFVGGAR
jgi:excisionase family DNA binding protein